MDPPFDAEAEQAVLGSVLLSPVLINRVATTLNPADFYTEKHLRIYEACLALAESETEIDNVSVGAQLARKGLLELCGGRAFLALLMRSTPTAANAEHYAALVKETAIKRRLRRLGEDLVIQTSDSLSSPEIVAKLRSELGHIEVGAGLGTGHRVPMLTVLGDVAPRRIEWLWDGYIPRGRLTILQGDPGVGKSWITLAVAAALSVGAPLPGESVGRIPTKVLLLSPEDDLADTIRPRLDALGADPRKIVALIGIREISGQQTVPSLARDLPLLDQELAGGDFSLVVIDPINAYMGVGIDTYRDSDVRSILGPLAAFGERHRVAILCVLHLTKSGRDHAIYRGQGSIAYVAAARVVLLVGRDPARPDRQVLIPIKSNLGQLPAGRDFQIREGTFLWIGKSDVSAEALLAPPETGEERSVRNEAEEFLRSALRAGPRAGLQLIHEAQAMGIGERTLWRAKHTLGIVAERLGEPGRKGGGHWVWKLPDRSYSATSPEQEPVADKLPIDLEAPELTSPRGRETPGG